MNIKSSTQVIPIAAAGWTERQQHRQQSACAGLWDLLDVVKDPEVPALSLWDLGVLQDIVRQDDGEIIVTITPTYSGCPALDAMRSDIGKALEQAGYTRYRINTRLAPAWTTDWLSPQAHEQLRTYGIAPPCSHCADGMTPDSGISCPQCGSENTRLISEFGSTACKALFQCDDCLEPFDYFKRL
ncbi:MAG: 1,2-phenylacetyl-CoA epoxidase subunit PaaD [Thiolinea sp.]